MHFSFTVLWQRFSSLNLQFFQFFNHKNMHIKYHKLHFCEKSLQNQTFLTVKITEKQTNNQTNKQKKKPVRSWRDWSGKLMMRALLEEFQSSTACAAWRAGIMNDVGQALASPFLQHQTSKITPNCFKYFENAKKFYPNEKKLPEQWWSQSCATDLQTRLSS